MGHTKGEPKIFIVGNEAYKQRIYPGLFFFFKKLPLPQSLGVSPGSLLNKLIYCAPFSLIRNNSQCKCQRFGWFESRSQCLAMVFKLSFLSFCKIN